MISSSLAPPVGHEKDFQITQQESADYQTELDRLSFCFTVTLALHVNAGHWLTWRSCYRPLSSVRTLYIESERKLDFAGWCSAIRVAANSGEDTLSEQQLTEADIPVTVHSCISYITQCGEDTHTADAHSHSSCDGVWLRLWSVWRFLGKLVTCWCVRDALSAFRQTDRVLVPSWSLRTWAFCPGDVTKSDIRSNPSSSQSRKDEPIRLDPNCESWVST